MRRRYDTPEFLPPSRKERDRAAVIEVVDQVVENRGRRQVEHSRACRALDGELDGCDGRCLPFVNRWAS